LKKVAVMVLVMALLMMMFAVPVMADSPKKTPVTADGITVVTDYFNAKTNPAEVTKFEWIFHGVIVVHMGEDVVFDYVDFVRATDFTPDKVKGVASVEMIWTNSEETGSFRGVAHWEETMPMFMQFTSRIVLHGTGIYQGQTLSLFGAFGYGVDNTYYGYLLVP
jgi:hypothetical protein